MRRFISIDIIVNYLGEEHRLSLRETSFTYKHGDDGFTINDAFPFFKAVNTYCSHNEEICDYKGESAYSFRIEASFDNGDKQSHDYVGTLHQNDFVFILWWYQDIVRKNGHEIPEVFLLEYAEGEEYEYPSPYPTFSVIDDKIEGHEYHFEGDILENEGNRIFEGERALAGEEFALVQQQLFAKYRPFMDELPKTSSFQVKLKGRKQVVDADNIGKLYPLIQKQYGLGHIIRGYYPTRSGLGFHLSVRMDGVKGAYYQTCSNKIKDIEGVFVTLTLVLVESAIKRLTGKRRNVFLDCRRDFSPYELIACPGEVGEIIRYMLDNLNLNNLLDLADSLQENEGKLLKNGYSQDSLDLAHDYLLRSHLCGIRKAKSLFDSKIGHINWAK